ncbi:60S ribosomal protein L36 [Apiospora arundinis]
MAITIIKSSPSEREPLIGNKKKSHVTVTTSYLSDDTGSEDDETDTEAAAASAPLYLHETTRTRFLVIFSQILVIQFIGCFDATIMASSHPVITSYFRTAPAASWLSTSFLLASTVSQPLIGRLSDATGRKPLFLASLAVFMATTAWCAAAQSIASLIAARGLDFVPVERRGLYYPYSSIIYGVGCTLGAAMGGFLAEHLGWRWIFASQIPIMLVCFCISALVIPHDLGVRDCTISMRDSLHDFDFVGSGLLCVILTTMIIGLNLGGQILPWSHPIVASALVVCVACIPVFLYVEWRCASHPLVPLDFISHSPKANLLASNFISTMLTNAVLFNMPIFLQAVLLASATRSGLHLMAPFAVTSVVSALTAYTIARTRCLRWSLVMGASFFLAGALTLTQLTRHTPPLVAVLALVPTSVGQGLQNPGTFLAVLAASGRDRQAVATSIMVLVRSVGQVVGIAASSLLLQAGLRHYLRRAGGEGPWSRRGDREGSGFD